MEFPVAAGATININRSDGRVHPAVVVAVNQEGNFVRVEWFENGETKGKDLDFRVASVLNPNLKFNPESSPQSIKRSVDDSLVKKVQRKGIPVNNRRTNVGGKKRMPTCNVVNESATSVTRSQYKEMVNQNSANQELRKNERTRSEKRPKGSSINAVVKKPLNNPYKKLATMVAEYRETLSYDPVDRDDVAEDHLITVCVRKRPLNKLEQGKQEVDIISVPKKNNLIVHEPKTKVDLTKYLENHNFKFDYTFDEQCDNSIVYKYTAQPLVKTIFQGGYATCFAYGQTGSGKTYTMSGDIMGQDVGIYVLAISDVFKLINSPQYRQLDLSVSCSFFEIYSGKVLDLLNSKVVLKILEDGKQQVQVVGLKEKYVTNTEEVLTLINKGNLLRTSGQTSANTNSSRSHAVFQICLRKNGSTTIHGKLSLIDLAGNERGADTFSSDRQTRLEGGEINKSLLALKECIRALGRKGSHLPFRVSKLTQVLRDSFVGSNSRTCMIAMVSPGVGSCENTLNTLRYADRVKELGSGDNTNDTSLTGVRLDTLKNTSSEKHSPSKEDEFLQMAELQDAENRLFSNHRLVLLKLNDLEREGRHLLKLTHDSEFDKNSYINKFEHLVDDTLSNLLVTKEYIDDFKAKLSKC